MSVLAVLGWMLTGGQLLRAGIWAALAAGALTYTVSEYGFHRYLFHLKPPRHPRLHALLRRLHYQHHAEPDDLAFILLPVWYSLPLMAGVTGLVYGLTGDPSVTTAFFTGTSTYLLYYEWTHYAAHRPLVPWTPWGRRMKKLHLLHHYQNEHHWFGVTNTVYDRMLGTLPPPREAGKSSTVRNLEA
ncbi:sterol desaturase family protein [Paenibacillus sp. CC-CFT747]|nr:sterol desaturase family protein [Paenibacillus sp. CC-CFT747]